jgi:DNA gyrase/topoisomerase IV subunit A
LISPDKIDEWIREVEERPASAELIIRYIARRLSELAARDEELMAQNIELLSGRKVEEYESRIASLEYQLELLKRQLGGEVVLPTELPSQEVVQEKINLLLYNPLGQVLRLEMNPKELEHGQTICQITGELTAGGMLPEVLATTGKEELLFIFDTGRTVRRAVTLLPPMDRTQPGWQKAYIEEPHVKEELAAIQPIGKMPLFELCIQASRRGYVKKMKTSFFTAHLEEDYIGSGVKVRADKTCGLTFANPDDLFVMVSQDGNIFSMQAEKLPSAIEEVIQLGVTDHIVSTFIIGQKPSLALITKNGKVVHRDIAWLEPANSFKSKGQAILSKARREAGVRIVGAAPVEEKDWGVVLQSDGRLVIHQLEQMLATGSVASARPENQVLGFSIFHSPEIKN